MTQQLEQKKVSILYKESHSYAGGENHYAVYFEDPEFYKQNGYEVFGTIEDHPKGFNQYFLHKRFDK